MAMKDLPEAERRALKKELEEEMAKARRKKLVCTGHHDYGNRYIYGSS
jgi:hypothetical protein